MSFVIPLSLEKRRRETTVMLSVKRKSWSFHVFIDRGRQTKCTKSVMHLQSCCFAHLNLAIGFVFVCLFV